MTEPDRGTRTAHPRADSRWPVTAIVLVTTVASYVLLLGWHQLPEYQTGKVWALIGVLAALAAWYGWRGQVQVGALAQALIVTVMWSVDATTSGTGGGEGMWLAGAIFVLFGALAGAGAIASAATVVRRLTTRRDGVNCARP